MNTTTRAFQNHGIKLMKPEDYDAMRSFAQQKRLESETSLQKVGSCVLSHHIKFAELHAESKQNQEDTKMQTHKLIWLEENNRLKKER